MSGMIVKALRGQSKPEPKAGIAQEEKTMQKPTSNKTKKQESRVPCRICKRLTSTAFFGDRCRNTAACCRRAMALGKKEFMIENGYAKKPRVICSACKRSPSFCICVPTTDSQEAGS